MTVTATKTVLDVVTEAMRTVNLVSVNATPPANMADSARITLNRMMKALQASEGLDWAVTRLSLVPVTGPAQTLLPPRPLRVRSMRFRRGGVDLTMQEMSGEEYDLLPQKSTTGTPTTYYYDRQREAAVLYVWPTLAAVTTETFEITCERELEDIASISDTIDAPSEWWDAIVLNLAERLAFDYQKQIPGLQQRAAMALNDAIAGQNYGSVFIGSHR